MSEVRLKAFAKINYALDLLGRRVDGYHEIRTVMQSISLADEVELRRSTRGFALSLGPGRREIGPPEQNTVYLAWKMLGRLVEGELPVEVTLHKRTPAGAGLGGGSADAAAVLVGLNEMFELGLRMDELREVGVEVGADVPFCISGGTALGEGVGEILTPLPAPPAHHLVVAKPPKSVETASVYRAYDVALAESSDASGAVVAALRSGSVPALAAAAGNDLSPVTEGFIPEVATLERELLTSGAFGTAMSGSGTAVYGIFDLEGAAERASDIVNAPFTGVYEPVPHGVEIV